VLVVVIIGADQATKSWAVHALAAKPIDLIGRHVQLALTRNSGSAFSRFQGYTPVIAIGAIVIAVILARALRAQHDRVLLVALGLVLGGALGNLVDRLARSPGFLRGEVVDFVKLGSFPVFNVADSALTVGAVLLALHGLRHPGDSSHEAGDLSSS
jgi:signal peptidase II